MTLSGAAIISAPAVGAAELPPGFSDRAIIDGLEQPTSMAFSPDGRIFVAEKRGLILSFDGPGDPIPRQVADLRTKVHSFYDRGLLSLALDPAFPRQPYVYAAYTYDAPLGGTAPVYGTGGGGTDACPGDAGSPDFPGCVVSSRVTRLKLGRHGVARREKVLVSDWCQQFLSHSIGDLAFDRQGALLIGGGEGASYLAADTGGYGDPPNACGDPPGEGGALRAQDALTTGDPLGLAGTIARIDPANGQAAPGNPTLASGNEGRIMSLGLRNPFRFVLRPGTDELFIADVGWSDYEEINMAVVGQRNDFGWPCFAGPVAEPAYAAVGAPVCRALFADPSAVTKPWFSYLHETPVATGEACPPGDAGSAISGVAFDRGRTFPAPFDDALLFADYVRGCIWSIAPGINGEPKRSTIRAFESEAQFPIDLVSGPGGLYYVDLIGGSIRLIAYDRPTVEIRLRTHPQGLDVELDSRTERSGSSITIKRGSVVSLRARPRQRHNRRTFAFAGWSDGGPRNHAIRGSASRTYTALYSCRKGCGK